MRGRGPKTRGALTHASIALLAGAVALATGCGGDDEDGGGLAELAPPDARLYAEVVLRPDSEQAEAIEAVTSQAAGIDDPGARLVSELDSLLSGELTYSDDIEPWLGAHGAVFIRSFEEGRGSGLPDFAALIEIDDLEAAEEFIGEVSGLDPGATEDRAYGGYEYLYAGDDGGFAAGIVEEALVFGTEASFKVAVDAADGESLAESAEFSERTDELDDDPLASLFVDPASAVEAAVASGELNRDDARMLRPVLASVGTAPLGAALDLDQDSASFEVTAMVENEDAVAPDGELLGELPAGATIAVALPHLGQTLEFAIDRIRTSGLPGAGSLREEIERRTGVDLSDVAGWLGSVSGFLSGGSPTDLVVGLVAETADPDGPRTLLDAIRRLIEREEPSVPVGAAPEGADYGFSIGVPGLGPQAGAGVFGDQLVAVLGAAPTEVLDPDERLADDEVFGEAADALGDEFDPLLFIDLPAVLPILRAGGADEGRDYAEAEPYFEAFRFLIAGAHLDDGLATVRFTVAVP